MSSDHLRVETGEREAFEVETMNDAARRGSGLTTGIQRRLRGIVEEAQKNIHLTLTKVAKLAIDIRVRIISDSTSLTLSPLIQLSCSPRVRTSAFILHVIAVTALKALADKEVEL